MASVIGLSQAAQAATPGIASSVLLNGEKYDGTTVVDEGAELTLRVQYNTDVAPGSTVVFDLGSNVTVSGVPASNSAIESVTQDGNKVSVTFRDPWPAGVNQGVFDLKFKVDNVDASTRDEITWKIDGDEQSVDVIIRNAGDQFANVTNGSAKSASPGNLDSFVTVTDGAVKLKAAIADQELTYTLRLDSAEARDDFTIADQLPAGLDYVSSSFTGQLTSWDADGLNRSTGAFSFAPTITGDSFSGTVNVPGPSVLSIGYKAMVTDVAALEALLQAKYDALGGGTGSFEIQLTNTASFGGTDKTASIRLRGNVAGVNIGQAFTKTSDWSTRNVVAGEDGTLTPPADVTYSLKADLRQWTGVPNFTLDRNVVVTDVLPAQASWNTAAADFITSTGMALTEVATPPADADAFAADAFVGQYWVDGQRLLVNVGRNSATNVTVAVKAHVNTVDGLTQTGSTTIKDATPYRLRNVASFAYRGASPYTATRDVTVVVLPDSAQGVNDSSVFTKNGTATDATIDPGDSVTVDYAFRVAAGKGIDARTSRIVDYVDTTIFDMTDVDAVAVTGTYDGQTLGATHFALSTDADGNLVIELSDAGKAIVDARGVDKRLDVLVSLTSKPFEGKETRTIKNKATLFGKDGTPLYWSETSTEATSYGDEAEVRKRVYDREAAEWVETLKARMDGAGNLVQDTYVYRVEFIPHGSYDNVVIVPVNDVLPDATDFLGFVTEADGATADNPTAGPVDIGGNIEATYNAVAGTVTLKQKTGTVLQAGSSIAAYFAVKVTDASAPILNKIGDTSAEIIPLRSVSVGDYVWVDTDRDGRQDADEPGIPDVVLTIVGPDGEPVTGVDGKLVGPVSTDADGKYTFDHLPALSGNQTYRVGIDRDASAEPLAPYIPTKDDEGDRDGDSSTWVASTEPGDLHDDGDRDPTLDFGFVVPSVSVGDYVWLDADRDGRQNLDESGVPGVVLTLLGPDGDPVTDVFGQPVGAVTTGPDGHYTFDDLPALTGDQTYTVVIDKEASAEVLKPYVPTKAGEGEREGDSSTWEASTGAGDLHENGDRDPTLDFGFVAKTYAIGDFVWIDADKDGVQDAGEKPLSGVKVELLDRGGKLVSTTTTDKNGRYVFDNLPAGTYQVWFTLTDQQKKKYELTGRDSGANDALDSDANRSDGLTRTIVLDDSNTALTGDYDYSPIEASQGIDPTWDAGVVVKDTPSGTEPEEAGNDVDDAGEDEAPGAKPDDSNGVLPNAGATFGLGALAAVLVLVGAGATLTRIGRRKDPVGHDSI